ncbi:hypothetical protein [Achromobacter sp. DMS1]|uniref:hypothetical protein n=1 Tax=Achromobacter sp. DMS1 TaxID=1688405 RepID=UPI00128F7DF4|nr:hypothetical protein [Achromobacter sp. DMS1]
MVVEKMIQWPPHSKITCLDFDNKIIAESKRSRLDLSDSLMLHYHEEKPLTCYVEVSTKSKEWKCWNSINVRRVESRIAYDLEFDGYKVKIDRISKPSKALCKRPFRWLLEISADYGDKGLSEERKSIGTRFRVARGDASIKTIQAEIERIFGLPRGCVCLFTPENKKAKPRSLIKSLRNKWKNG